MLSWETMLSQIASVLALIACGWLLFRLRVFANEMIRPACTLVLEFTLPALILTRLVLTVSAAELKASWYIPLLGAALVGFSQLIAHFAVRLAPDAHRATLEFCATFPNWFYLALAVLEPVFGSPATRILILLNIGIHLWVWSFGLMPFGHNISLARRVARCLLSPPLAATALGVLCVLHLPWLALLAATPNHQIAQLSWTQQSFVAFWHALEQAATITIPLSMLTVGAQLATATFAGHGGLWGTVWGVTQRLALIPTLTLGVMVLAWLAGWHPDSVFFLVLLLTAAMPTAVVAGQVAELYEGDAALAGRLTFLTTLLSLASVPLWYVAGGHALNWLKNLH